MAGTRGEQNLARAATPPSELSDIELVDNVLRGAPGAVESFYQRHSQLIYHCIRSRADRQDVDDVFQAFFERLMKNDYRVLALWQRGSSLPVYLSSVIRNFVIDFHRGRRISRVSARGLVCQRADPAAARTRWKGSVVLLAAEWPARRDGHGPGRGARSICARVGRSHIR